MRLKWVACVAALAVALGALPAAANESVAAAANNPANWALQLGNYAGWRYSSLDQITTDNVRDLKVAWQFSTGVLRGHEGAPLVVGSVMYLHTPFPNNVFALDLDNEQRILWKYAPKQDPFVVSVMCCDTVNRGLAYAEGMILLYQADTALVALDARTGKEKWKVVNGNPRIAETGTGAPIVVKDKVIVGVSGADHGVRCHVTAYALKDGKRLWRAYATGPDSDILVDPEKTLSLGKPVGRDSSLKTWTGDQWRIGGGSTWGWFSYDPALDLVYYGTGNPSTWNPSQRAGPDGKPIDQKWSMTIFARDPDTGIARWAYQMTPFDEWDYDGVNEMILVDGMPIDGVKRNVLVHFDRNGFAYTIDRATGEPLIARPYDNGLNWSTGVVLDKSAPDYGRPKVVPGKSTFLNGPDEITRYICPGALGFKNEQPASYSPLTGYFYIPANSVCMDMEPFKVTYTPGQPYVGATLQLFPPAGKSTTGRFTIYDAAAGRIVSTHDEQFSVWSGVLTTAGGIACYGTLEGYFKCRDQTGGRELFKHRLPSGSIGNVFTYAHNGKQYIGLYSGVGGWAGIGLAAGLDKPDDGAGAVGNYAGLKAYTDLGGTLTVYALP
jgi:PQQ-dependent dehydrogenase (methanol/ethanol family)